MGIQLENAGAFLGQHAPRGLGHRHAQADVREERLGKDGAGHGQGHVDDDDGQGVGQQVLADDAPGLGAHGLGGPRTRRAMPVQPVVA